MPAHGCKPHASVALARSLQNTRTVVRPKSRVKAAIASGLTAFLSATAAHASGLSVARFGGEHGYPVTSNPTALYYNPAGIADSSGGHLYLDLTTAWRRTRYDRPADPTDAPDQPGAEGANTGEAKLLNPVFSPMGALTYQFGKVAIGAAYYTPFGGQSAWSQRSAFENNSVAPGAVDGTQRWYSIEGELRASVLAVGAAYDFGPVSAGLTANLMETVVDTLRARDPAGSDDVRREGRSLLQGKSFDPAFGIGLTYKAIADRLAIGASYQSRPNVVGGVRASGTLTTVLANQIKSTNDVDFNTDWPDVVRLGARYRPNEDIELRLFGDYQRWSVVENHCVSAKGTKCEVNADGSAAGGEVVLNQVRDWHDTAGVRVGASYWLRPEIELFGGAGFTSNAIPDRTLEPALPDWHSFSVALGGRFALVESLHLMTTYTEVFYLARDTSGQSIHPDLQPPSRSPSSGGKYSQQLGALNVNLDWAF